MARFNIRVYGVLIDPNKRVLISDEYIRGGFFTKFPGGGLEFGEGTRDCLKREFKEETDLDVEVGDHIYTTDFYQLSAFNNNDQIISIYYFVHGDASQLETKTDRFDFIPHQISDPEGEAEVFRWISLDELDESMMDLPIDKLVVKMIKEKS
jgi:8-oxo-dGTP diphosphatase